MSATILQFVPKARREQPRDESAIPFRSPIHPDDLVMGHADTAPCECIGPREEWQNQDEPA